MGVHRSVSAWRFLVVSCRRSCDNCLFVDAYVLQDIFRRYPNQYESIIAQLCENLESLDEPEAKASMIWIIGEYAERIDNADELLETFLETFPEETSMVRSQSTELVPALGVDTSKLLAVHSYCFHCLL